MMKKLLFSLAGVLFTLPLSAQPKLVLQITVDQLRADLPTRFMDRMGDDGFAWLYREGIVYRDAHHAHANTETIVGHVTLSTGADPAAHGMVGNVWYDRGLGRLVYNIEDARYELLTAGAGVDQETEIDPTQRAAKVTGRSPANIEVTTIADEISIHTAGQAKVFGVSVKDRGAVAMAGHSGKAFWFSKQSGDFVTSTFYYDSYPEWVTAWNATQPIAKYDSASWELLHDQSTYLYGDMDDAEWETDFPGYGRTFPHPFGPMDGKYFTTLLTLSPAGDELTLDFAKTLIEKEQIGADAVTDYLAVSFSSTDYVGHIFGPSSLEMEDNLLHLDRYIADLLSFVDEQVGLENTLVVLSADHGGPEVPGYLNTMGIEARYMEPETWDREAGIERLKEQFGIGEELITEYFHPYLYLNHEAIEENGLDLADVQEAVAMELMKFDGIAMAATSEAIIEGDLPDTLVTRAILRNHHLRRSGDIFIVFEPHAFINDFDGLTVASTHGSPWRYDTHVPIIFAGLDLAPATIDCSVHTVDVARTIAAFLETKPPSGASGNVLTEVTQNQ
ncbi:MAG: alkaline phosphatase family protein [Puniceicoccaceae bacterium]